jgi:hypothetical protein
VDRSPPPPKTTTVQIQERNRDEETGAVELKLTQLSQLDPVFGNFSRVNLAVSEEISGFFSDWSL